MCGIFGFYGIEDTDGNLLTKMGTILCHRGPDGCGYYRDTNKKIHLGCRRLSIIDIKGSNQPVTNENNSIITVCNGEVYNYVELRAYLLKKGHTFLTTGDTEIIPHAYEEWGDDFMIHLNGMFAIALWDTINERLLLVRDRLGIKPLYYYCQGEKLIFSSELKAIGAYPGITLAEDTNAIVTYFRHLFIPAPATPYVGVKKMISGTFIIKERKRMREQRYWNLSSEDCIKKVHDIEIATEMLYELIKNAITIQMRSDVPIGCFLSGGIDSGTITAFAALCSSKK